MPARRSSPQPSPAELSCWHRKPARLSWARLLKRVVEIDLEHCQNCGGELKIIAAIVEAPVIQRIHTHLGLQARGACASTGARVHAARGLISTSSPHQAASASRPMGPAAADAC